MVYKTGWNKVTESIANANERKPHSKALFFSIISLSSEMCLTGGK
jgi:hypothetical protein